MDNNMQLRRGEMHWIHFSGSTLQSFSSQNYWHNCGSPAVVCDKYFSIAFPHVDLCHSIYFV